jgi:hypothetical protein
MSSRICVFAIFAGKKFACPPLPFSFHKLKHTKSSICTENFGRYSPMRVGAFSWIHTFPILLQSWFSAVKLNRYYNLYLEPDRWLTFPVFSVFYAIYTCTLQYTYPSQSLPESNVLDTILTQNNHVFQSRLLQEDGNLNTMYVYAKAKS